MLYGTTAIDVWVTLTCILTDYNKFSVPEEYIGAISTLVRRCIERVRVLFAYKQSLIGQKKPIVSRKLHLLLHLTSMIEQFGSLLGQDTERWEAFNKTTKSVYGSTQKRRSGVLESMMYSVCVCKMSIS